MTKTTTPTDIQKMIEEFEDEERWRPLKEEPSEVRKGKRYTFTIQRPDGSLLKIG